MVVVEYEGVWSHLRINFYVARSDAGRRIMSEVEIEGSCAGLGPAGPRGLQGPVGPAGPAGPAGPSGVAGPSSGAFLKTSVLTSSGGAGVFTTGPNTHTVKIRGVGGGGAGGGATTGGAGSSSAGGGGGAGGYAEWTQTVLPNTAYNYTIGARGTGAAPPAAGTAGGDSTFTIGVTTITAAGGLPGVVGSATISGFQYSAGGVGGGGANADYLGGGESGDYGVASHDFTAGVSGAVGGAGGSSVLGTGAGPSLGGVAAGANAVAVGVIFNWGGGGGGASTVDAGASQSGGNGMHGGWIVDEYS